MTAAVRIISYDEATTVELRDTANGLYVETVQEPEEAVREIRTTAPRVDGSFVVAEADSDGQMNVLLRIEGSTWAQCATRWQTIRTALRAESTYYVETVVEGVTTRWQTSRPNVTPAGIDGGAVYGSKVQKYQLQFRVQPNPTVTIA